jgi:RNA polymerase sigma-70 factor, ECF subfamily
LSTDENLYACLRKGDKDCLVELVARLYGPLLKYLYRMTGNEQIAEDLVQEVFIRIITFQGEEPLLFKPWAFTIARNLGRDYFRSAAYRHDMSENLDGEDNLLRGDSSPGVEQVIIFGDDRIEVSSALQQLPHEQREVLVLRFYHDLHLEEIAEITGTPLGTVKSRLYTSLKRLKNFLEREERSAYERAQ